MTGPTDLDFIFGVGSRGHTPEERAETSSRAYVRSQVQLAFWSEGARGIKMNARQALHSFGIRALEQVAEEGASGLVTDPRQPWETIRTRRRYLDIAKTSLAEAADVPLASVQSAETAGAITPIRELERIAQTLSLNERLLGHRAEKLGDKKLATRLREVTPTERRNDQFVVALSEAAWVIGREAELSRELNAGDHRIDLFDAKHKDYDKPAYQTGYRLAEQTRELLGLTPMEPVVRLRHLVEERLGIPVVDVDMGDGIAGATISNGGIRGVALAPEPRPLVRRITLAHELGHLLWDPEAILDRVRIDRSDDTGHKQRDPVEIRANAFGIAFLAPLEAIRNIYDTTKSAERTVERLVEDYGISHSAAVAHLRGICDLQLTETRYRPSNDIFTHWLRRELSTPLVPNAPLSRQGRFARLVLQAVDRDLITRDTAATWLRISVDQLPEIG